jgi:hypothetical protein
MSRADLASGGPSMSGRRYTSSASQSSAVLASKLMMATSDSISSHAWSLMLFGGASLTARAASVMSQFCPAKVVPRPAAFAPSENIFGEMERSASPGLPE